MKFLITFLSSSMASLRTGSANGRNAITAVARRMFTVIQSAPHFMGEFSRAELLIQLIRHGLKAMQPTWSATACFSPTRSSD